MPVYKQKSKTQDGLIKESEFYHYRFMVNGKNHNGVCKGCTTEADAKKFEKDIKVEVLQLSKQKTVTALVENYRDILTGGTPILLDDAYELSMNKTRKRQPSESLKNAKRVYWLDFVSFMHNKYPDVSKLASVQKTHAEAYINHLRTKGRFNREITFKSKKKTCAYQSKEKLSPRTCNVYQHTLTEVFNKLRSDSGLINNPFDDIEKQDNEYESREAFSEKELVLIRDNGNDFIRALFFIGITTALREGDICSLLWSEVDLKNKLITRKMKKTRRFVEIPITMPLLIFLEEQKNKTAESEYVLPEHAAIYKSNPSGISARVKKFLEGLGITTTRKVEGRDRAVSIKDVHSLRHSFCYYAGLSGIPLMVVQSIVGHMTPEMTKHYQAHATREDKRKKMLLMPDFMGLSGLDIKALPAFEIDQLRAQLIDCVNTVNNIDSIKAALAVFKN
jgi:integrase